MSIKIKGLEQLTKDLRKFGADGERVVKTEINISATNIERGAINRAPFSISGVPVGIKQRINKVFEDSGLKAKVGVEGFDPFPAYVEFGTGMNFTELVASDPSNYDESVRELARQFYVNGLGTLPASPYLFPSFFEERPELIEQLRKELDKLAKSV